MTFRWLVLILFGTTAVRAQTTILIEAPLFAAKEITLLTAMDPISGRDSVLTIATADSAGRVTLTAEISGIGLFQIAVNRFRSPIYLQSQHSYNLVVTPNRADALVDTWQKGSFEYQFATLDSTDINAAILAFDSWYFQTEIDFLQNRKLSALRKSCEESEDRLRALHPSTFYKTYAEYGVAELLLSAGSNKQELYSTYFFDRPTVITNPAWFNFFDAYYADYFKTFDGRFGGATIYNRMKKGAPADSLDTLIAEKDTTLNDPSMRYLVVLKSIAESYTDPKYPLESSKAWVAFVQAKSADPSIKKVAANLLKKMNRRQEGQLLETYIPAWRKVKSSQEYSLPSLVIIHHSANTTARKEAAVLTELNAKYGDFFRVIEFDLNLNDTNLQRPWTRLELTNQAAVMDGLDIYSLPHYLWVSSEGVILESALDKPSVSLEKRLYKIQTDWQDADRIKVGMD